MGVEYHEGVLETLDEEEGEDDVLQVEAWRKWMYHRWNNSYH